MTPIHERDGASAAPDGWMRKDPEFDQNQPEPTSVMMPIAADPEGRSPRVSLAQLSNDTAGPSSQAGHGVKWGAWLVSHLLPRRQGYTDGIKFEEK